jgi:hypothetical protein
MAGTPYLDGKQCLWGGAAPTGSIHESNFRADSCWRNAPWHGYNQSIELIQLTFLNAGCIGPG